MRAVGIRFRVADLHIRWKTKRNLCPLAVYPAAPHLIVVGLFRIA